MRKKNRGDTVKTLDISSLPQMLFAHEYQAESYHNSFSVSSRFIEISYFVEGSAVLLSGGESFRIEPRDVSCLLHERPAELSAVGFHRHRTVGIAVNWSFSDSPDGLYLPPLLRADSGTEELCRLIDAFVFRQTFYKASSARFAEKALELLCGVDRLARQTDAVRLPSDQAYTERAKKYVEQNIYRPIAQQTVAAFLGISPGYLCSVFRKVEGVSLMKYINRTKLESMKALMDSENIRLCQAAPLYGYNDPNYVSRLYKQLFGFNLTDRPRSANADDSANAP